MMYLSRILKRLKCLGPAISKSLILLMPLAAAGGNVTLDWNPSPSAGVTGYCIYYGGSSGVYTNKLFAGNVTSVTICKWVGGAT